MNERLSYWLVPAEPDKARFAEIIRSLAKRFAAPAFEPHVTLYSGPRDARDNPQQIIGEVARGISQITLQTSGVGGSQEFTKTLFVEFAANDVLAKLSSELKRHSAQPNHYQLKPHLSLIYARLDSAMKEQLAKEISVPQRVRFDALKAIISRERTQSGEDVSAWRIVAQHSLVVH
jgi:2'-5' RNA ligase